MSLNQSFISDFSESEKNCQAVYQYLVHILSPVTVFFMTMQISTKECAGREDRTRDCLVTRR